MRCCCDVLEVTKIHRNSLKCYGPWSMVHGPYPSQACWESWLFGFPLPKKPACARKPHETSMFLVFCFGCYSCFSPHDVTVCPHPRWCGPLCGWLARSCVWTAIMSSSFSVFFAMHSGTGVRVFFKWGTPSYDPASCNRWVMRWCHFYFYFFLVGTPTHSLRNTDVDVALCGLA